MIYDTSFLEEDKELLQELDLFYKTWLTGDLSISKSNNPDYLKVMKTTSDDESFYR